MNDLLQELRSATSTLHRELDGLVPDPASDPATYGHYLSRFHEGVAASWTMLDWGELGALALPEPSRRKQRYHALENDLERLAILYAKLRDHTGAGAAASTGCLYVLEGSIHGGRILLGRLAGHPDLPDDSLSFLRAFGNENSRMWASFIDWLNSIDTTPAFIEEAREAAIRTFRHFINSFRQN